MAAGALASPGVTVQCAPFEHTLAHVRRGDFVYLDPPDAPLSATSNFSSYTAPGFLDFDQARLRDAVVDAARKGASILLSNSTASSIVALYDDPSVRGAGLRWPSGAGAAGQQLASERARRD